MQAITKIVIFIVGISVLAGIVGASIYVHKNGLSLNHSNHNSSNQLTNDTIQNAPTTITELQSDHTTEQPKRAKRAIIFRPLFVYRQQQVRKQRLSAEREQQLLQQMSTTTQRPQKPKYASNYPYNG